MTTGDPIFDCCGGYVFIGHKQNCHRKQLDDFYDNLLTHSVQLPHDISEMVDEHFWELIDSGGTIDPNETVHKTHPGKPRPGKSKKIKLN